MPTDWRPFSVKMSDGGYFTEDSAWNFVADAIEQGCQIDEISLKIPAGKTGYVMKLRTYEREVIYVKLQLGSNCVLGRSFHVSYLH